MHGLTLRTVQPIRLILPIAVAAANLERFYIAVYYKAANEWIRSYPQISADFIIRWSGFELSFVSNEGAPRGIPWEFVRDFAYIMGQVTAMGYTGCYDQGYWSAGGDFGVYVGLRILGS